MDLIPKLRAAFLRLSTGSISSIVLVKIATSITVSLAYSSPAVAEMLPKFLGTAIGSYCDADCLSSSDDIPQSHVMRSLAQIAMFQSPISMFTFITKHLRPHYSRCTRTGEYESSGNCVDTCLCYSNEVASNMYRYGLDVVKYTWVSERTPHPPVGYVEMLAVLQTIDSEIAKKAMFRFLLNCSSSDRDSLCMEQVGKILGNTPMNVPRFFLTLSFADMNLFQEGSMRTITPKLWYAVHLHCSDNTCDQSMRAVLQYISHRSLLWGKQGTIKTFSNRPLDLLFIYCAYVKRTHDWNTKTLHDIIHTAFHELYTMDTSKAYRHRVLFCENLVKAQMSILGNTLPIFAMVNVFLMLINRGQYIPSCISPILFQTIAAGLQHYKENVDTINNKELAALTLHLLRQETAVEGGPLTSLVTTGDLLGNGSRTLVDLMKSYLTEAERVSVLECVDHKDRTILHHLILSDAIQGMSPESEGENDGSYASMVELCSCFIKWNPSLLLKQDCNRCTPIDYRHDLSFMEQVLYKLCI